MGILLNTATKLFVIYLLLLGAASGLKSSSPEIGVPLYLQLRGFGMQFVTALHLESDERGYDPSTDVRRMGY